MTVLQRCAISSQRRIRILIEKTLVSYSPKNYGTHFSWKRNKRDLLGNSKKKPRDYGRCPLEKGMTAPASGLLPCVVEGLSLGDKEPSVGSRSG